MCRCAVKKLHTHSRPRGSGPTRSRIRVAYEYTRAQVRWVTAIDFWSTTPRLYKAPGPQGPVSKVWKSSCGIAVTEITSVDMNTPASAVTRRLEPCAWQGVSRSFYTRRCKKVRWHWNTVAVLQFADQVHFSLNWFGPSVHMLSK